MKQDTNYSGDISTLFCLDNDPEIESKYHHYNLCLVLFNNSYLEFTRWHYYSEYVFLYMAKYYYLYKAKKSIQKVLR